MEEKKEEAETKLLTLENPYQSIPFAIVLAIPAIANEVYIMNEETQLFVCFGLFVGSVYSLAGDAIGAALDEKGQAIMAEHHALEDVQISLPRPATVPAFLALQEPQHRGLRLGLRNHLLKLNLITRGHLVTWLKVGPRWARCIVYK